MMKGSSFLKLDISGKYVLFKAFFFLCSMRIMIWIFPFHYLQNLIKKFSYKPKEYMPHNIPLERLIQAVEIMSRYMPKSTCLTRALAAQMLLSQYRYTSNVKIGVSKENGEFEAHAWLEVDNKIILGESDTLYTTILNTGEKIK